MNDDVLEIQVACFRLGNDLYAVDIMRIREIIRPQKFTVLPRTPAFVEGIINLRGVVIQVIDMHRRFGLPPRPIVHTSRLLIVTIAEQLIGLVVDDVTEVLTVPVRDIKPPPKVAGGIGAEYLVGICLAKDSMIMLLNLDRMLTDSEADEMKGFVC
jgi:purine-binding chemotaxis protein CheW